MPWQEMRKEMERIAFVLAAVSRGKRSLASVCRQFGISRPTGRLWLRRVVEGEWVLASLRDRSRRPHCSPWRTASALEAAVLRVRQAEGWGAKKIACRLRAEGLVLPVITINRILKRRGQVETARCGYAAVRRFARAEPNELVQLDFKGDYPLLRGRCYPLTLLDDHSRFALGLYALADQSGAGVQRCLASCFERSGVPTAMLMDHGSPWFSTTNVFGLTSLSVWLLKQGIELTYSGVGHPQTQGKIERFHRTLKASLRHHGQPQTLRGFQAALDRFREVYNHERPHEALAMAVPAAHYRPSQRPYQARPREWEYPPGSRVLRLNQQGVLSCPGGRRFVCEALANERVAIEEVNQHWLVKYRHQYIREIDLATGRTLPPSPTRRQFSPEVNPVERMS